MSTCFLELPSSIMTWTPERSQWIEHLLPKPRRKAEIDNLTFLNALQYIYENNKKPFASLLPIRKASPVRPSRFRTH